VSTHAAGRTLPKVTRENEHFWRGGSRGELVILRCASCGHWLHPPAPICSKCQSRELAPQPTSGRGFVYTYTVNHQAWTPDREVPYVIAIVELDDQAGLRLTTNVAAPISEVAIGLRVAVAFEAVDDVYLPYFVPESV
jgi:uncharacterized protein